MNTYIIKYTISAFGPIKLTSKKHIIEKPNKITIIKIKKKRLVFTKTHVVLRLLSCILKKKNVVLIPCAYTNCVRTFPEGEVLKYNINMICRT